MSDTEHVFQFGLPRMFLNLRFRAVFVGFFFSLAGWFTYTLVGRCLHDSRGSSPRTLWLFFPASRLASPRRATVCQSSGLLGHVPGSDGLADWLWPAWAKEEDLAPIEGCSR